MLVLECATSWSRLSMRRWSSTTQSRMARYASKVTRWPTCMRIVSRRKPTSSPMTRRRLLYIQKFVPAKLRTATFARPSTPILSRNVVNEVPLGPATWNALLAKKYPRTSLRSSQFAHDMLRIRVILLVSDGGGGRERVLTPKTGDCCTCYCMWGHWMWAFRTAPPQAARLPIRSCRSCCGFRLGGRRWCGAYDR
jgi:hypothetical protein